MRKKSCLKMIGLVFLACVLGASRDLYAQDGGNAGVNVFENQGRCIALKDNDMFYLYASLDCTHFDRQYVSIRDTSEDYVSGIRTIGFINPKITTHGKQVEWLVFSRKPRQVSFLGNIYAPIVKDLDSLEFRDYPRTHIPYLLFKVRENEYLYVAKEQFHPDKYLYMGPLSEMKQVNIKALNYDLCGCVRLDTEIGRFEYNDLSFPKISLWQGKNITKLNIQLYQIELVSKEARLSLKVAQK